MSFHFCAHAWEVRAVEDGTLVAISNRDLDLETITSLVDDLLELVRESGLPNLYLDFSNIGLIASIVLGKLVALDALLHEQGGRLTLIQVGPATSELIQAAQLTHVLDVRPRELAMVP